MIFLDAKIATKPNKRRNKKGHTKTGQIFRNVAYALTKSKNTALVAFYHRIKAKKEPLIAIKAPARRIEALYYKVYKTGRKRDY